MKKYYNFVTNKFLVLLEFKISNLNSFKCIRSDESILMSQLTIV